jgi:hypothetical protein
MRKKTPEVEAETREMRMGIELPMDQSLAVVVVGEDAVPVVDLINKQNKFPKQDERIRYITQSSI